MLHHCFICLLLWVLSYSTCLFRASDRNFSSFASLKPFMQCCETKGNSPLQPSLLVFHAHPFYSSVNFRNSSLVGSSLRIMTTAWLIVPLLLALRNFPVWPLCGLISQSLPFHFEDCFFPLVHIPFIYQMFENINAFPLPSFFLSVDTKTHPFIFLKNPPYGTFVVLML